MSTRTDNLRELLSISESVDHYKKLLRVTNKSYRATSDAGLTLSSVEHDIAKYRRVINILELRFNRLSNDTK